MALLIGTGLGMAALSGASAFMMAHLLRTGNAQARAITVAGLLATAGGIGAGRIIERVLAERLGQHYVQELRTGLMAAVMTNKPSVGITIARITNDLTSVRNWVAQGIAALAVGIPVIVGTTAALWFLSPPLAMAIALPLCILGVALALLARPAFHQSPGAAQEARPAGSAGIRYRRCHRDDQGRRRRAAGGTANPQARQRSRHRRHRPGQGGRLYPCRRGRQRSGHGSHRRRHGFLAVDPHGHNSRRADPCRPAGAPRERSGTGGRITPDLQCRETHDRSQPRTRGQATGDGPAATPGGPTDRTPRRRRPWAGRETPPASLSGSPACAWTETGRPRSWRPSLETGSSSEKLPEPGEATELFEKLLALRTDPQLNAWVAGRDLRSAPSSERRRLAGYAAKGAFTERGTIARAVRYRHPDLPQSETGQILARVGARRPRGANAERRADHASTRRRTLTVSDRARLQLARATLGDPPLLLLNHIDSDLGPEGCRMLAEILRSYPGVAIIASDHPDQFVSAYTVWDLN